MPDKDLPPVIKEAIEAEAERLYPSGPYCCKYLRAAHITAMTRAYWMVIDALLEGAAIYQKHLIDLGPTLFDKESAQKDQFDYMKKLFKVK